ncbi:MAG: thiamine phosphate synthase [Pyrinomonadaceae bacterium]
MPLNPQSPLLYLITSGATTAQTTPANKEFSAVLLLIEAAVAAGIDLVQIREKRLTASVLYTLAVTAVEITRTTSTRLLVNDRADVACGAGADGVHLTTKSLPVNVVRRTFGADFLIGVSTHSFEEAESARREGADFAVFGPVFGTVSKQPYGEPLGLTHLATVTSSLSSFPIIALGGLTAGNATACIRAGAHGIAGISMFSDPLQLDRVVKEIRLNFEER